MPIKRRSSLHLKATKANHQMTVEPKDRISRASISKRQDIKVAVLSRMSRSKLLPTVIRIQSKRSHCARSGHIHKAAPV